MIASEREDVVHLRPGGATATRTFIARRRDGGYLLETPRSSSYRPLPSTSGSPVGTCLESYCFVSRSFTNVFTTNARSTHRFHCMRTIARRSFSRNQRGSEHLRPLPSPWTRRLSGPVVVASRLPARCPQSFLCCAPKQATECAQQYLSDINYWEILFQVLFLPAHLFAWNINMSTLLH